MVQLSLYTFVSINLSLVISHWLSLSGSLSLPDHHLQHVPLLLGNLHGLISGKVCNASSRVVVYPHSSLLFCFCSQGKQQKEMGELGLPWNKAI